MKITFLTLGSRGDVEPFVALAVGLQRAGHRTKVVTPARYHPWVQAYGVETAPLRFDLVDFLREQEDARKQRRRQTDARSTKQRLADGLQSACDDYLDASRDADFVVQGGVAHGAVDIAETLDIPIAFAYLHPFAPTGAFPTFYLPLRGSLGAAYNRFTHRLALKVIWDHFGPGLNRWRTSRLHRPAWGSYREMLSAPQQGGAPTLLGYSTYLLPRPDDWNAELHVTGAWHLDPAPGWTPSPDLAAFLASGPPPVYVGFGSMRGSDPAVLTEQVLQALRTMGQRGVLLSGGGGGLTRCDAGPDVFFVDEVPHGWLFPRMTTIVHHGGAGTTANAIRAGVPNIVVPRVVDQFAWGDRVQTLGIGLRVSRMSKLNAEKLASALQVVMTRRYPCFSSDLIQSPWVDHSAAAASCRA